MANLFLPLAPLKAHLDYVTQPSDVRHMITFYKKGLGPLSRQNQEGGFLEGIGWGFYLNPLLSDQTVMFPISNGFVT